uniref:Uncharacterized protein n=1 Tax=Anguilla anguilla TaxID=7936 RepID=A0A0E9VZ53_ANGAN
MERCRAAVLFFYFTLKIASNSDPSNKV